MNLARAGDNVRRAALQRTALARQRARYRLEELRARFAPLVELAAQRRTWERAIEADLLARREAYTIH